jgi:hypothetical protein
VFAKAKKRKPCKLKLLRSWPFKIFIYPLVHSCSRSASSTSSTQHPATAWTSTNGPRHS